MTKNISQEWKITGHPAEHWHSVGNGRVSCRLCPRFCRIPLGKIGFCGVRENREGQLYSLNYGKSVPITCESIETEAVFHYAPGESILSLGNIGCMMKCDFCQNWSTSQSRLVMDENVSYVTPQGVIDYALEHGIRMLSWTYNDPVVWHEFVVETARLSKTHGIKNLYKSAFYISPEAIADLIEVMDIFSISVKSLNAEQYWETTKGKMQPILDGILQVYDAIKGGADIHLELSNLCVTGRNDNLKESMAVANWMLAHLDANIPLHYVRFHPDYLYTKVERTDPQFLEEARAAALEAGLKYVYVGNVHGTPSSNTYCPACQTPLIERYGLSATNHLKEGGCPNCGLKIPIVMPWKQAVKEAVHIDLPAGVKDVELAFRGVIRSCHVEKSDAHPIYYQFEDSQGEVIGEVSKIGCDRFMLSSPSEAAQKVRFFYLDKAPLIFEVYDRAHFPTVEVYQSVMTGEDIPPVLLGQTIR